ncbi:MAG: RDD family protein [Shimia sp.]
MHAQTYAPYAALPDPDTQPAFYAGVPTKRLLAWIADTVVILVLTFVASILTLGIGFLLFFALYGVMSFLYRTLTIAGGSATWGMRLMGIELRNMHGEKLGGLEALLHTVAYMISFGMVLVQAASIALMLGTPRGQGLGDMLFGTVALNRKGRW